MKIKVIYSSKVGNTKKIAEVIAKAVGAAAEPISQNPHIDSFDILFIGSGVYWGKLDSKTKSYIEKLNPKQIKNVAVFGTFGHLQNSITTMKRMFKEKGINVLDKSFGCKGRFLFLNNKHPNEQDLADAKEFAAAVVEDKTGHVHTFRS